MSELTKSDAELVYKHLPETARGDVEYEAYAETLSEWRDDRPDDLDELEAAHEDDSSPFEWEHYDLTFERSQTDGSDELVPHTMAGGATEDIYDLAKDFGWDYVRNVRAEVRDLQESTVLSPKEFVAFVLSETHLTYEEAASEMGIASGTYGSKMSREVTPEIEAAEETVRLAEKLSQ